MKRIPLTQGKVALVDDKDFKELSRYKWCAAKTRYNTFRVIRTEKGTTKTIYMHRQIMGFPKKMHVDHKNHNTLDNRRDNLRVCTNSQNHQNRLSHKNSISKYKGVCWLKTQKKWVAGIELNGRKTHLGCFTDETEAAKAYDEAAKKLFGEFAHLNFKEVKK